MHSSRKARCGKAARGEANADELLFLLERATDAYYKAKHHGLKDSWRKQMDRLEISLHLFESDEHTNGAIDALPPDTTEQNVPHIRPLMVRMILIDADADIYILARVFSELT
jgi:hypothetical protein